MQCLPPPNKTITKFTSLRFPLPLPPHHHPITYFVMFFVELELVSFLNCFSCYPIKNIVLVNTKKSKNNHKNITCMISTLHYFCSPPPAHIHSKLFLPPPTTQQHNHNHNHNPYCHYLPLCLLTHPLIISFFTVLKKASHTKNHPSIFLLPHK